MSFAITPATKTPAAKTAAAGPKPAVQPPKGGGGSPGGGNLLGGTYTFPNTTFGAAPSSELFQLQNTSSAAVRLTSAGLSSPTPQLWSTDISNLDGQLFQPGDTATFTVTFTPPAPPS
jgi:hypothetical protein